MNTHPLGRLATHALLLFGGIAPALAQDAAAPQVAMPYYSAEQAMEGLYSRHLPPLAQAFRTQAVQLAGTAERYCQGQARLPELRAQWQQALLSWETLSTPAVGPLVNRRSQRQIDFWPTRPDLLRRSMERAPATLADMERVGTPAKGFPALEQLIAQWGAPGQPARPPETACRYGSLVAQGIAVEARELQSALAELADKDWSDAPEDTLASMAEWVNQWLAGLERLRWAHIEKPLQTQQTTGAQAKAPAFARLSREDNLQDWRAQWQSLRSQGRLTPEQLRQPPQASRSLVPLEALLMGKGQLALAHRWAQALDRVNQGVEQLQPRASTRELLALSQSMKTVTVLFQNEVAAALDVPLGFSDADGD